MSFYWAFYLLHNSNGPKILVACKKRYTLLFPKFYLGTMVSLFVSIEKRSHSVRFNGNKYD